LLDFVMEDERVKQRHDAQFAAPLAQVFAALVEVAARGRWGNPLASPDLAPRAGVDYVQQRGKVLRRGRVLECLRPLSLKLDEALLDPPCCVRLKLHWRVEPLENGSYLLLDARYTLNGAATLRRKHWSERIHGHCARMHEAIAKRLVTMSEHADISRDPNSFVSVQGCKVQS
jgi:hypothetical protein